VLEVGFERGPEFPQENNSRFLPNVKCKVTSKECMIWGGWMLGYIPSNLSIVSKNSMLGI